MIWLFMSLSFILQLAVAALGLFMPLDFLMIPSRLMTPEGSADRDALRVFVGWPHQPQGWCGVFV